MDKWRSAKGNGCVKERRESKEEGHGAIAWRWQLEIG